jgi:hypothetical protein
VSCPYTCITKDIVRLTVDYRVTASTPLQVYTRKSFASISNIVHFIANDYTNELSSLPTVLLSVSYLPQLRYPF